ncbi:MAG: hypothetical protein PUP92_09025 [Rhizonema sp. PD38]|nr:hypothetical protein [Rhizonema sp. PD38]
MSKTNQGLIHVVLEPVKKLKSILSERIKHVEDEIEHFNNQFMHDSH